MEEEKEELQEIDSYTIIEYIKQSIEILLSINNNAQSANEDKEKSNKENFNTVNSSILTEKSDLGKEYEKMI